MRLSENIEKSGFFWLPEDTQNRLPGVLRISKSGEITLEVFQLSDPLWSADGNLNRIVGIIDNTLITLDKCFYRKKPLLPSGVSTATIDVHRAFIGASYGEREEATFSKVTFSVEGLDEWLAISGLNVKHNLEDKNVSIYFKLPQEIALHLPDGIELKFGFTATVPSPLGFNITKATINQKSHIALISENVRPLDDFLPLVFKLHVFLCFAIDKIVSLESIVGEKDEIPVKIHYQSLPYSETIPKIYWHEMLFRYKDIAEQLKEILTKWIKKYEICEPAFNLYFAQKSGAHKYLDSKFLSLAQGIETLHRRNSRRTVMPKEEFSSLVATILTAVPDSKQNFIKERLKYANELPLRQRIKKMIEPFKIFFKNQNRCDSFINKVIDTRNYLTHYDSDRTSQTDLLELHRKLEALFQLQLLRLIGFDTDFIHSIVQKSHSLRAKLGIEHQTSSENSM